MPRLAVDDGERRSLRSDGFCRPSSMTMTLAPLAAARRAPASRSRATTVGAHAGEEQRLVADIGRAVPCQRRPEPGRRAGRHSRALRKAGAAPSSRSTRASASAVGVLPAPPAVKLPTQITGSRRAFARAPHPPRRDRAVERAAGRSSARSARSTARHQKAGARISARSSFICAMKGSIACTVRSSAPPRPSTAPRRGASHVAHRAGIGEQLIERA